MQNKLDDFGQYLKVTGIKNLADLKTAYNDFKTDEERDYYKLFYWSLYSYFAGMQALSSGLIEKNIEPGAKDKFIIAFTKKIAEYGIKITDGIPIVSGVLSTVEGAISDIYGYHKDKIAEKKIQKFKEIVKQFLDQKSLDLFVQTLAVTMVKINSKSLEPSASQENENKTSKISSVYSFAKKIVTKAILSPFQRFNNPKNDAEQLAFDDVVKCIYALINSDAINDFFERVEKGEKPEKVLIEMIIPKLEELGKEIAKDAMEQALAFLSDIFADEAKAASIVSTSTYDQETKDDTGTIGDTDTSGQEDFVMIN